MTRHTLLHLPILTNHAQAGLVAVLIVVVLAATLAGPLLGAIRKGHR